MRDLDSFVAAYLPSSASEIENDLMLKWYPSRIASRLTECGTLLELGLGHGYTASIFNRCCNKHLIIEGSVEIIDLFKRNHPNFPATVVREYFETFDTEEVFDCIIMGFILEHVDDRDYLLARYKKFMKPDGVMYITVPNAKSLNRRLGVELGIIEDIYSLNENDLSLGHKRQFCRDTLKELIVRQGYTITYEEGIYLKPLPLSTLQTLPDVKGNMEAMLRVGIEFPELCVGLLMEVKAA